MPALNPFLRALFQSSVLGHALTSQHYVLLVPTTDSLINGRDRENGKRYSELVQDEDFLGSHILRLSPNEHGARDTSTRDGRGKAKSYNTVNSRTVLIKESIVYTNKGFKNLTQAQLLNDILYHSPVSDSQQYLIFFISKPLTGSFERVVVSPAVFGNSHQQEGPPPQSSRPLQPTKKDIKSFSDLLNHFPMIARQMHPSLERLFNEFGKELGKPLPLPPSISLSNESASDINAPDTNLLKNGTAEEPTVQRLNSEDDEDLMRRALETAVTAAIDLFQGVDKQQLSFLGATTDLTGPAIEKLIERYVAEYVHDSLLFPRLCSLHRNSDHDLDRRIRQMDCIDAAQVGIAFDDDNYGKKELLERIDRGVLIFRKMGVASSPQQMLDILLETQKAVSEPPKKRGVLHDAEKRSPVLTINADVLVSLLLLVVIRSQVRHLQARLTYMQRFILIDDIDSGENGYALSTLEAVLTYLSVDSSGLRRASKRNKALWDAVKTGDIPSTRSIFEGSRELTVVDETNDDPPNNLALSRTTTRSSLSTIGAQDLTSSQSKNLAHVFPFQAAVPEQNSKKKKRVHMDARSMSISSAVSVLSRTATLESTLSGIEGDLSIQSLAQTQDAAGNSVLMMAVEGQQPGSLKYLLSMTDHYQIATVLRDTTAEGTTLLSAAIQLSHESLIDIVLDYVLERVDTAGFVEYLSMPDTRGRTAAHYIFNAPYLIKSLSRVLPWQMKDKLGHTPLFAICRAYDHVEYSSMVSDALAAAKAQQKHRGPLRLEDHADVKGNTLLHIINDPIIMQRVLVHCDSNPNAMNEKKFTPLMLASKYGRVDMVRVFFGDPRVDLRLREARGLTAVELAKDDEVRNRIDDLTLFSDNGTTPTDDVSGRLTSIVRSYFVEDGSTRFIVKSGALSATVPNTTYTITTSRRSIQDFVNLAQWLSLEHPASYMPSITLDNFRSSFQIHSKPSRAVLYDQQIRLDRSLKLLIAHPTFATHEMLWEFFLVPDMEPGQIVSRAQMKAESLRETVMEDFEPLTQDADLDAVGSMVAHSRDMVLKVNLATRSVIRRGQIYLHATSDMAESLILTSAQVSSMAPPSVTLPTDHADAFGKMASLMQCDLMFSPLANYVWALASFHSSIAAIQAGLNRPTNLIRQISSIRKELDRQRTTLLTNSLPKKGLINIQLLNTEETRIKSMRDAERGISQAETEIDQKGRELRYTHEVIVGELAGWTTWREEFSQQEIRRLARMTVIRERERLKEMQRVLRSLQASIT